MHKHIRISAACLCLLAVLGCSRAEEAASKPVTFDKLGLKFEHPAHMKTEGKNIAGQNVMITVESASSVLITITRVAGGDKEGLAEFRSDMLKNFLTRMKAMGGKEQEPKEKKVKTEIMGGEREGEAVEITLAGLTNRLTAYAFIVGEHTYGVMTMHDNEDAAEAAKAFPVVLKSLAVSKP